MLLPDLYQAILARRSVRQYDRQPLDQAVLAQVQVGISAVQPLIPENEFWAVQRDDVLRADLVSVLGAYGHLVTPPHAIVPYGIGETHVLEDLGYRVEQIAVHLTRLGIGSCYIGTLPREAEARTRFGLPEGARIGALLVFGYAATGLGGRTLNALVRAVAGATSRLPLECIFFQDSFEQPALPPTWLTPVIEAARVAPSACNAQPWRFLWRAGQLHLFVTRYNRRYGKGASQAYCFYDAGICMANIVLALQSFGLSAGWTMYRSAETSDIPSHPADLYPIAKLELPEDSLRHKLGTS